MLGPEIDPATVDLEDFAGREQPADPRAAREHVAWILDRLPDRHAAILALRFLHGHTIREAAAELDVSVANAKVLQHRALRAAANLEREGDTL